MRRDELERLICELNERAFCYDAPADYRAGIEAMARKLEMLVVLDDTDDSLIGAARVS